MDKKLLAIIAIIFFLVMFAIFPVSILAVPHMAPAEYLITIPYLEIGNIILITPSSTFLVYLLGAITITFGIRLYQKRENETKKLWGLSLILWGIGTFLAGTSYQGFGYELKCSGQAFCLFTSWFELSYLFITAVSITVMAYAVSVNALVGLTQNIYRKTAVIGLLIYSMSLLIGVIFEINFLITYEYFLIFFVLYFLSFFILNISKYKKNNNPLDKGLIIVWIFMLIINIIYFIYFYSGIPENLYINQNIWFSANDVLHIGLIGWMVYIYYVIGKQEYSS